jgi:hypothetical protein
MSGGSDIGGSGGIDFRNVASCCSASVRASDARRIREGTSLRVHAPPAPLGGFFEISVSHSIGTVYNEYVNSRMSRNAPPRLRPYCSRRWATSFCLLGFSAALALGASECCCAGSVTAEFLGRNDWGQAVNPGELYDLRRISGGVLHSIAIRSDASVVVWGNNSDGQLLAPQDLERVLEVSAGYYHCAVLEISGRVRCWGRNSDGQCDVPVGLDEVTQISAGGYHTMARLRSGAVRCWGRSLAGQTMVPAGMSASSHVSAGGGFSVSLGLDGRAWAWGDNQSGQTSIPSASYGMLRVDAGGQHVIGLLESGTVVAWGSNSYGQVSVPAGIVATDVGAGALHSVALRADGTVLSWGAGTTNLGFSPHFGQSSSFDTQGDPVLGIGTGAYLTVAMVYRECDTDWLSTRLAVDDGLGVFATRMPCSSCQEDLDLSRSVDLGDVAFALLSYGPCPGCAADLDGTGEVDFGDVALILLSTGPCQ